MACAGENRLTLRQADYSFSTDDADDTDIFRRFICEICVIFGKECGRSEVVALVRGRFIFSRGAFKKANGDSIFPRGIPAGENESFPGHFGNSILVRDGFIFKNGNVAGPNQNLAGHFGRRPAAFSVAWRG